MSETFICDYCGGEFPTTMQTPVGEDHLCDDCISESTTVCSRCGTRVYRASNDGDDATPLCQRCYDRYYTTCVDCDRVILLDDAYYESDDDDDPRCYSCHCRHNNEDRYIHDYYYKPEPVFYGEGNRYFGVELEIDGAGESESNARKICDVANRYAELVYIKHDGSLEEGMEIVTEPLTLHYHLNNMPWADLLAKAKELNYTSHAASTCGLHVHINKTAFGKTEAEQDACIARVLYFFEKHWEELLKFSRRTRSQLDQWAARYGLKEHPKDILDHAKGNWERYTCVNLTNRHTIEFRMFRGTLKLTSLVATLQLLDRICDVALFLSDEEIKAMPWTTFVAGCSHLPVLVQYLKERRLYVNEPVEMEVEV